MKFPQYQKCSPCIGIFTSTMLMLPWKGGKITFWDGRFSQWGICNTNYFTPEIPACVRVFDHSGHESQFKTHSELWQHIAKDNKLLTSCSPNSENLAQMLLLLWEQTAMMRQQLLLRSGTGPLWYQQSPALINISNCCKQQDWFFTCLSVLSWPFLLPQALSYLLEKNINFASAAEKPWALISDILLWKSNYQH